MGIFIGIWIVVIVTSLIGIQVAGNSQARRRGKKGESEVKNILETFQRKEPDKYILLNDVLLSSVQGMTQIDHILISIYGIFLIETKNYTGIISGSENADQWVKNMYGSKYRFLNPIRQNYSHMAALMDKTGIDKEKIFPIVVFMPNCKLQVHTKQPVIYTTKLTRHIKEYQVPLFTEAQIQTISEKITSNNKISEEDRRKHIEQVKQKKEAYRLKLFQHICPKCGGKLVKRNGKYGEFTGCSNYPKCSYTTR